MKLLKLFYGDWRGKRIGRLIFLAAAICIWAASYGLDRLLWIMFSERLETSGYRGLFELAAASVPGFLLTNIAYLNIVAKRFRDIDGSGWIASITITSIDFVVIFTAPNIFFRGSASPSPPPWRSLLPTCCQEPHAEDWTHPRVTPASESNIPVVFRVGEVDPIALLP